MDNSTADNYASYSNDLEAKIKYLGERADGVSVVKGDPLTYEQKQKILRSLYQKGILSRFFEKANEDDFDSILSDISAVVLEVTHENRTVNLADNKFKDVIWLNESEQKTNRHGEFVTEMMNGKLIAKASLSQRSYPIWVADGYVNYYYSRGSSKHFNFLFNPHNDRRFSQNAHDSILMPDELRTYMRQREKVWERMISPTNVQPDYSFEKILAYGYLCRLLPLKTRSKILFELDANKHFKLHIHLTEQSSQVNKLSREVLGIDIIGPQIEKQPFILDIKLPAETVKKESGKEDDPIETKELELLKTAFEEELPNQCTLLIQHYPILDSHGLDEHALTSFIVRIIHNYIDQHIQELIAGEIDAKIKNKSQIDFSLLIRMSYEKWHRMKERMRVVKHDEALINNGITGQFQKWFNLIDEQMKAKDEKRKKSDEISGTYDDSDLFE